MSQNHTDQLSSLLAQSQNTVIFTGAGISTESGIPDFRSPGTGIWTQNQPIDFSEFLASEEARKETWRRKLQIDPVMSAAEPNTGHFAIAQLVQTGQVSSIITQNIDGLHQKSGVPDTQMIELHGNTTYCVCLDCGTRHELQPIMMAFEADESLPLCQECNGIVKTATISFGQPMPEAEMARAKEATLQSDLFISIGSSLVVYPAAGFPLLAKQNGAKLVILNREPTQLDVEADLVIHDEIGPTLNKLNF
tara:strand:+ start:4838 stop:5587 length:750 start_codon:yes stop_codon:yes gene_type:complete